MDPDQIRTIAKLFTDMVNRKAHSVNLGKFQNEYYAHVKLSYSKKYARSVQLSLKHLVKYFGTEKLITEITVREFESFLQELIKSAPKGVKVYYRDLRAAFNKAKDWEYLNHNIIEKIKIPKQQKNRPETITRTELDTILDQIKNEQVKAIAFTSFLTGCRIGEVVNLQIKNINLISDIIYVGDSDFTTKTKRQRIIPINPELKQLLLQVIGKSKEGYVFSKPGGFRFSEDYVSKSFKKAVRAVGLSEAIHFHSLRHSFASNLVQQGVSPLVIRDLLGHTSLTTSEIYMQVNKESLKAAVLLMSSAA